LPQSQYEPFIQLITEPNFTVVKLTGSIASSQRENFAKTVLRVMAAQGRDVEVVKALLEADILATEDPNILFRGNTLGTKIMDQYMKFAGMDYLHSTIGSLLRSIYKNKEVCEIDPSRVDGPEALKKNFKRLIQLVSTVWDAILKSLDKCPRYVIHQVYQRWYLITCCFV
jgi:hypothetical protein